MDTRAAERPVVVGLGKVDPALVTGVLGPTIDFIPTPTDDDLAVAQGAIVRADAVVDAAFLDRAPRMRVLARFASNSRGPGAVGTLECSRVVVGPQCGLSIEVYGTEGSATWTFERMNELKLAVGRGGANAGYTTILGNPGMGDYGKFQPGPGNSMGYDDLKVIEARKFLQSVTQGVAGACTIDDAQSAAEVVSAAVQSAETGAWVKVPAVTGATYGGEPAGAGAGQ